MDISILAGGQSFFFLLFFIQIIGKKDDLSGV